MERHPLLAVPLVALLAAAALTAPADAQERQDRRMGFTLVPQVGLAFHTAYYDDRVVTTLTEAEDIVVDRVTIDPGAAFRVEGRFEYDYVPRVRFHGGIAMSWPSADVQVGTQAQSEVAVNVLELTGGATLEIAEITDEQLPLYFGLEGGIVHHGFDEFQWRDEFIDPASTSLSLGGRLGAEYPLTENISARGELKETLVWGAYGGLEGDIQSIESRRAGVPADTDFEGNTFSMFSVNAGLTISF